MPAWWRSSCGSPCRDGSVFTKNKNAGLTSSVFSATIHLAFAGVAHLVERDLAKVEVASSSLVARSKKKHHPSGWCFLFGMPRAGLNSLPRPARSALNQEVWQGSCEWLCHSWDAGSESSLVTLFAFAVCEAYKQQNLWAVTKKKDTHMGVFLFWSSTFAMQKWSPAGG